MSDRIMIAGTGSGCGKTSVACGLMAALQNRGGRIAACKCGPDYIDPMFHRQVLGTPSRNLDLFLCGQAAVRSLLGASCAAADTVVVEGVMGFYDGLAWTGEASSHHLSQCTDTPVLLVVGCGGKSLSLAAEIQGYARFAPNNIAGILLNRCNSRSYPLLKGLIEEHTGLPVVGYLPSLPQAALESRHLGLVTAAEVTDLRQKIDVLASQMEETFDLDRILAIAATAPPLEGALPPPAPIAQVRIGVAQDAAFCFTYADNLALLEGLGAEIVPFSPLTDTALPDNLHGLLLSGGYPELYAGQLSANTTLLAQLKAAIHSGMPTIAECGGFMLLCNRLTTVEGEHFPMAGAIDADIAMTRKLSPFGYVTLTAREDTLLCSAGESLRAHEFHYSAATRPGNAFRAEKLGGAAWDCVHATGSLYAGYPHLHLWGNIPAAERFVRRCDQWRKQP